MARALRERKVATYNEDSGGEMDALLVSEASKRGILRFAFDKRGGSAQGRAVADKPARRGGDGGSSDGVELVDSDSSGGSRRAKRSKRSGGPAAKMAGALAAGGRPQRAAAAVATAQARAQLSGKGNRRDDHGGSDSQDDEGSADSGSSEDEDEAEREFDSDEKSHGDDESEDAIEVSDNGDQPAIVKRKATRQVPARGRSTRAEAAPANAAKATRSRPVRQARRQAIIEPESEDEDDVDGDGGAAHDSSSQAPTSSDEDDGDADDGISLEDSTAATSNDEGDVVVGTDEEGSGGGRQDGGGGRAARVVLSSDDEAEEQELVRAAEDFVRPTPKGDIERIIRRDDDNPNKYICKLHGWSWRNLASLSEKQIINQRRQQLLRNFLQSGAEPYDVDEQWTQVERVLDREGARGKKGQRPQYLVKWRGLEYSKSTWERELELVSDLDKLREYKARCRRPPPPPSGPRAAVESAKTFAMPQFRSGRTLRDYQDTSVRWMVSNFRCGRSCVLGDEMGLGKTAQSIAVLEVLRRLDGVRGPFLLVAPLTTLGHWQREIQTWTDLNAVLYAGGHEDRQIIQDVELFYGKPRAGCRVYMPEDVKAEAILVSYETLLKDRLLFKKFMFRAAIFDEAHKLKGINSSTRAAVEDLQVGWKLLLTGTPVQNNLSELFSILNLLDAESHPSWDEFQERFGNGTAGSTTEREVAELKEVLKPILLRRMKEDVETLPEKEEVIVWVQLTAEQRAYYKGIYENQIGALLGGTTNKNLPQMRNLAMELRKVCNHPFLCNGLEDDIAARRAEMRSAGISERDLIESSCGKMVLLGKLLPRLRAEGRRVLIFSQFKIMLNVLEDYVRCHGWPCERIDGSITGRDRQAAIDRYTNGTDENSFVFLLSTRAGGQGITLTVADTCIIYDSDWNPQNDLQAMARCHRIGQMKEVTVYRLISKDTYEEQLFSTASRKYGLDEAILGTGEASGDPEADTARIASLLRHGAHSLAAGGAAEAAEAAFQREDIDEILASRTEKRTIGGKAGNSFSVANFSVNEAVAAGNDAAADVNDPDYWIKLMPSAAEAFREREERAKREKAGLSEVLHAPRVRKQVNYAVDVETKGKRGRGGRGGRAAAFFASAGSGSDYSGGEDSDRESGEGGEKAARGDGRRPAKPRTWLKRDIRAVEEKLLVVGTGLSVDALRDELRPGRHTFGQSCGLPEETTAEEVAALAGCLATLLRGAADGAAKVKSIKDETFMRARVQLRLAGLSTAAPAADADGAGAPPPQPVDPSAAAAAAAAAETSVHAERLLETARELCPKTASDYVCTMDNMRRLLRNNPASRVRDMDEATRLHAALAKAAAEGRPCPWQAGAAPRPHRAPVGMFGALPFWWTESMDKALVCAVAKHGLHWRATVVAGLRDPELPLADVLTELGDPADDGTEGFGGAGGWGRKDEHRREALHEIADDAQRAEAQARLLARMREDHAAMAEREGVPPELYCGGPPGPEHVSPTARPHRLNKAEWRALLDELQRRVKALVRAVLAPEPRPPQPLPQPLRYGTLLVGGGGVAAAAAHLPAHAGPQPAQQQTGDTPTVNNSGDSSSGGGISGGDGSGSASPGSKRAADGGLPAAPPAKRPMVESGGGSGAGAAAQPMSQPPLSAGSLSRKFSQRGISAFFPRMSAGKRPSEVETALSPRKHLLASAAAASAMPGDAATDAAAPAVVGVAAAKPGLSLEVGARSAPCVVVLGSSCAAAPVPLVERTETIGAQLSAAASDKDVIELE